MCQYQTIARFKPLVRGKIVHEISYCLSCEDLKATSYKSNQEIDRFIHKDLAELVPDSDKALTYCHTLIRNERAMVKPEWWDDVTDRY